MPGRQVSSPVVLVVMDGVGVNPAKSNNALYLANTPRLDELYDHYAHTTLQASGEAVGVADGQMGNSEIGHMTLGCGGIMRQDIVRIDDAIASGEFEQNQAIVDALMAAKFAQRPMHLMGLVSDGGVHSALNHLKALIRLCQRSGVKPLLHMITDGRDTAPQSALSFLAPIESMLKAAGGGIATISGRYYAMDRDKRWDRIELAWQAMVQGEGVKAQSAEAVLHQAYAQGESDEFIVPTVLPAWQAPLSAEPMISFNFRKDRPRQIVTALAAKEFDEFDRANTPLFKVTCMTAYGSDMQMPYAFSPEKPQATLGEVLSQHGVKQFRCAETEKYPHVTYFFNGGREQPYSGENRLLIPSPKVATYDQKPEMSADRVADAVIDAIAKQEYGFILVNFANGDMVGHTAVRDAVIKAVETLDLQLGRVVDAAREYGYAVVVTADHGNCEEMIDPLSDAVHTQHTLYPVPCLIVDDTPWRLSCAGGLADVAATVLHLMNLPKPEAMAGNSLLIKSLQVSKPYQSMQGAA